MPPPGLDEHRGLSEAVEDLAIEQFVAKRPIEALVVTILPWRTRRDVERLHADLGEPFLDRRGNKFRTIVGPDIGWRPARDEQLGECCQHVFMLELTGNDECQALAAGLVDDRQDAELATVMGAALDEVIRPDMPRILGAKSDARPVVQPQPAALRLLLRDLQSFAPPDALDTLTVHRPPRAAQQGRHSAIAITSILLGQRDDVFGQGLLVVSPARHDALRRSMLPEHAAYPPLRRRQQLPNMIDATPPPRGAQKFPRAAS